MLRVLLGVCRPLPIVASLLAVACAVAACARDVAEETGEAGSPIAEVPSTPIREQSVGNCWAYSALGVVESLHKGRTGQDIDLSEAWITYWYAFERITSDPTANTLDYGATWEKAAALMARYGIVTEAEFAPANRRLTSDVRDREAAGRIDWALQVGNLRRESARRDRATVRAELDAAFGLRRETIAQLDAVFGRAVERTLQSHYVDRAPEAPVLRPRDILLRLRDATTGSDVDATLEDAVGTTELFGIRTGPMAYRRQIYPVDAAGRRAMQKRVQRALHARLPVVLDWRVDHNAVTGQGRFSYAELRRRGPSSRYGHSTVIHDYEADVPGLGRLRAGVQASPVQMEAALADAVRIDFFRVRNSWGLAGLMTAGGYNDVELLYLDGPFPDCEAFSARGTHCAEPVMGLVLPPGF